jgi:hypothetical protein
MQSLWFELSAIVSAQLASVAAQKSAVWWDNPPWPLPLQNLQPTQPDVLFMLNRGDRWISASGLREKRVLRFVVGASSVREKALVLPAVDALHFAARDALRTASFLAQFQTAGALNLNEVEIEPDLQAAMAAGLVLMSAFEVQYYQTYPNAAR